MPELPEVEAARRAIEENCVGKKIKRSVVAVDDKVIDGVSPSEFEAALTGKTIVAAHRKGKNMWIQLDSPPFPSFQFGMAGAIYIKGVAVTKYKRSAVNDTDEWPSKYSKLFIELDDGLELSFTDKRRFAKVRLLKNPASMPPISELGPDALLEPMTKDELFKSLSKKKMVIKTLLLDQSFISGVGNWIADEVLYQARIHPSHNAASISKEMCASLHNSLKEVIGKAVEVGADDSRYPSNWIFHSREKKPGKAFVDGKKIEFINVGGRTTAFVPELQKLSGEQAAKELVKPVKRSKKGKDEADETDNKPQTRPRKESNDKAEDADSEDEEAAQSAKPTGGKKTTGSRTKKPPAKRKSNKSSDDHDEQEEQAAQTEEDKKPATRKKLKESAGNKRAPARKKMEASENDKNSDAAGSGDDEGEGVGEKRVQVKGKKEVAKKVSTARQAKKRAK